MDKKGTKTLFVGTREWLKGIKRPEAYFIISGIRNIIGQEGNFKDEKGTTPLLGMIENEQKSLKSKRNIIGQNRNINGWKRNKNSL